MNVELRHLRNLIAIADEGSFTDAALVLGVSQASVSRSLAALERALGRVLVHRTTRTVELTASGRDFLASARRIVGDLDRAVAASRGTAHDLRLGYAWAALGAHTTSFLRAWNRANPETPIRMVHASSRDVGLDTGMSDLAVVRHPLDDPRFESVVVGREARRYAVAIDHPLADRPSLRLEDALQYVVGVDARTGTTSTALWSDAGLRSTPEIAITVDIDEWLDLVAEGRIIGVTSIATAHHQPRPGVVFLPIRDAPPIDVRLVWPRGHRHPQTDRVIAHLRSVYAG